MFYLALLICCCVVLFFVGFVYFSLVKVKMGAPPIKRLLIAYKYCYRNYRHSSSIKELRSLFPNSNLVKLCYCGVKGDHVEYATGVVLRENNINIDSALLEATFRKGFSLFITPEISHSVYTEVPTRYWFPLSYIVAITMSYPRLFSFIESHRLCGYPVLEIYKKTSLSVIVPLIRQDEFVVNEATNVVSGKICSALLRPLAPLPPLHFKVDGDEKKSSVKKRSLKQKG